MSDKKKEQLGMNPSTAHSALRKEIMFHLAKKLGEDICHQCGEKIETVREFSVEHKIPWMDSEDPKGLFFDMENISFSHLSCNIKAGRKPKQKYFTEEERRIASNKYNREYRKANPESTKKSRKQNYINNGH